MQISSNETQKVLRYAPRAARPRKRPPVKDLADLAHRYEVDLEEAKAVARRSQAMEEDPVRERRVREIARRIAEGTYQVSSEQIIDLAIRRAIVDQIR